MQLILKIIYLLLVCCLLYLGLSFSFIELMMDFSNFFLHSLLILAVNELLVGKLLLQGIDDLLQRSAF